MKKFVSREEAVAGGGEELVSYAIDESATIANLRGEDIDDALLMMTIREQSCIIAGSLS